MHVFETRDQVLIFENPGTTVRKGPGFDYWVLQFWKDSKEESSLSRKRSSWRINRKKK